MSLEIINSCPKCGSPVYGKRYLEESEEPVIKRTCTCIWKASEEKSVLDHAHTAPVTSKNIQDFMSTK